MGFSVLAIFRSVFRFWCPLRFPVFPFFSVWFFGFLAKIKHVRFLCGSLCSQMLGYFICFYFTVNTGQTPMWDSGFFDQRAFCERNIQWRIFVNSPRHLRADKPVLRSSDCPPKSGRQTANSIVVKLWESCWSIFKLSVHIY